MSKLTKEQEIACCKWLLKRRGCAVWPLYRETCRVMAFDVDCDASAVQAWDDEDEDEGTLDVIPTCDENVGPARVYRLRRRIEVLNGTPSYPARTEVLPLHSHNVAIGAEAGYSPMDAKQEGGRCVRGRTFTPQRIEASVEKIRLGFDASRAFGPDPIEPALALMRITRAQCREAPYGVKAKIAACQEAIEHMAGGQHRRADVWAGCKVQITNARRAYDMADIVRIFDERVLEVAEAEFVRLGGVVPWAAAEGGEVIPARPLNGLERPRETMVGNVVVGGSG